jgi:hypothetical protein
MKHIKVFIPIIIAVFFISACSRLKESLQKDDKKEPTESKTITDSFSKPQASNTKEETSKEQSSKETKTTGGIEDLSYDVSSIPSDIKYDGNIVAGATWKDNNGSNVLIITETKERKKGNQEFQSWSKELYGYQFITGSDGAKQVWKINDFIKDCEADPTLSCIKNSLSITDINNNGVAESTFLYLLACRSDVSPAGLKLLMHEGDRKYAIRGTTKIVIKGEGANTYGGETNVDKSFDDAPDGFLKYAKEQWSKYRVEKFGE